MKSPVYVSSVFYACHPSATKLHYTPKCIPTNKLFLPGERRIRVHTIALPVTNSLTEIHAGADAIAVIGLLAKMGTYSHDNRVLGREYSLQSKPREKYH